MNFLKTTSYIIVLIGALNWGFIGSFNFDLVVFLFGKGSVLTNIVYNIVGLSAILSAILTISCNTGNNSAC